MWLKWYVSSNGARLKSRAGEEINRVCERCLGAISISISNCLETALDELAAQCTFNSHVARKSLEAFKWHRSPPLSLSVLNSVHTFRSPTTDIIHCTFNFLSLFRFFFCFLRSRSISIFLWPSGFRLWLGKTRNSHNLTSF